MKKGCLFLCLACVSALITSCSNPMNSSNSIQAAKGYKDAVFNDLDEIIISKLELSNASVANAIDKLNDLAQKHYIEHNNAVRRVNVLLVESLNPQQTRTTLSVSAQDISLLDAVHIVCKKSGLQCEIKGNIIYIQNSPVDSSEQQEQ